MLLERIFKGLRSKVNFFVSKVYFENVVKGLSFSMCLKMVKSAMYGYVRVCLYFLGSLQNFLTKFSTAFTLLKGLENV